MCFINLNFFLGVKLTVLCDLNGEIRYLSPLVGAAKSDIEHMRNQLSILNTLLSPEHEIVLDKAYEPIEKDMENVVVHVKHKNQKLVFSVKKKKWRIEKWRRFVEKLNQSLQDPKTALKSSEKSFA